MQKTLYETLNVSSSASAREITAAYRRLIVHYHPDKAVGLSAEAQADSKAITQALNEAYAVLRDPEARRRYDASLRQGPVPDDDPLSPDPASEPVRTWRRTPPRSASAYTAEEERRGIAAAWALLSLALSSLLFLPLFFGFIGVSELVIRKLTYSWPARDFDMFLGRGFRVSLGGNVHQFTALWVSGFLAALIIFAGLSGLAARSGRRLPLPLLLPLLLANPVGLWWVFGEIDMFEPGLALTAATLIGAAAGNWLGQQQRG